MIRLRSEVLVEAPEERIWAWLNDLPTHYRAWHPDHLECRYARGERLEAGAVLIVAERLHGRVHHLRLLATEVQPPRIVRYRGRGFRGAFLLESVNGDATRFTAELAFGSRLPGLGSLLDALARRLLADRLAALQRHMREEGENLKRIMEASEADRSRP